MNKIQIYISESNLNLSDFFSVLNKKNYPCLKDVSILLDIFSINQAEDKDKDAIDIVSNTIKKLP